MRVSTLCASFGASMALGAVVVAIAAGLAALGPASVGRAGIEALLLLSQSG